MNKKARYGVFVLGDLVSIHTTKEEAVMEKKKWLQNMNPKYDKRNYAKVREVKTNE